MRTIALCLFTSIALGTEKPRPEELMDAVQRASIAAVKGLLVQGADVNAANGVGATALMWAVPDLEKVKLLVAHGAHVNARSTNLGRTAFLIAASYPGTVPLLRYLVSKGADPKATDRNGSNAVRLAALSADVDVIRYLLDLGLDAGSMSAGSPQTPLGLAARRRYRPTTDLLLSRGAPAPKNISGITSWAPPEMVNVMLQRGADINARTTPFGRTAVIFAAASDHDSLPTLKFLLEKGADPNLADADGETALDWAMHRNDRARIELLQAHGAKDAQTPRDQTFGKPEGIADTRTSLTRAISKLQPISAPAFRQRACITCHNQSMVAQVEAAARAKGIPVDEKLAAQNLKQIEAVYKPISEEAMQGAPPPGNDLTLGYIAMALAAGKHPLDGLTAGLAHVVASRQMADGSWPEFESRPPMEYSTISQTAMAVRVLTLYPIPARRADFAMRLKRARQWLLTAQPGSAEESAMRIMGLKWSGATRDEIDPGVQSWIAKQRADGGWQQLPQLEPDAYATGITLYALAQAEIPATDPAYRKGVAWLLANQHADGTWFVHTRSFPVQPQFESGYPYGYHQWISAAGACWASLAIAHTL